MKFGVLGTGMVGEALAGKLVSLGHGVKLGSRAESAGKAAAWVARTGPRASSGSYAQACASCASCDGRLRRAAAARVASS
jgi:hypothetical protein